MTGTEFDWLLKSNNITPMDYAGYCGISIPTVYNIINSDLVKNVYIIALHSLINLKKEKKEND